MEEKYYVPDISEFHVGFEYEIQDIENAQWGIIKQSSGFGAFDDDIDDLEEGRIRVKYLSKSDIEELGWKENYAPSYRTDELIKLYTSGNENKWYNLEFEDTKLLITECEIYNEISGNWNQELIFKGIIKNKSELIKIMSQLGITNG